MFTTADTSNGIPQRSQKQIVFSDILKSF